jgi:hypothetical protein
LATAAAAADTSSSTTSDDAIPAGEPSSRTQPATSPPPLAKTEKSLLSLATFRFPFLLFLSFVFHSFFFTSHGIVEETNPPFYFASNHITTGCFY